MITEKPHGRNELKFLLNYAEYLSISGRISHFLEYDKHAGKDGYFIRSVYFDDIYESAYHEKLAGVCQRKKYRIRAYNNSSAYITLECKEKYNKWVKKSSAVINDDICGKLIEGDFSVLECKTEQVCKDFYVTAHEAGMRPSVIVDYHREAYVYPVSNLRVTFDKNLHAGGITEFAMFDNLDSNQLTLPIYMDNSVIMEVKYDTYLPEFVRNLIPQYIGVPLSVSKYCLCKEVWKTIKF